VNRRFLLAGAIFSEVAASLSLKAALGYPGFYLVVVVGYAASFALFDALLKAGMGLGVAYGIWGAIGVATVAMASAVIFGEALDVTAWMGIGLVVLGVLVVELGSNRAERSTVEEHGVGL
jgi:small multidrug resistance pump